MKQIIAGIGGAFIVAGSILYLTAWYINLPVMGKDHLTGECVWVEIAPNFERRECPAKLPTKYHPVPVRSYDGTSSGHWGIGVSNE